MGLQEIISSNARYHTSPGFTFSFKCFSHLTCRKLGEPSLRLRRKKLSLQYATRVSSQSKHSAKNIIFKPSYTEKIVNKPKEIKQLGLRLKDDLDKLRIISGSILQNDDEDIPPWTYNSPKININLSNIKKVITFI
jgi:hypothetical protein